LKYVAETSLGPLELELSQVGGSMLVRLVSTGDTWNSRYTLEDLPLSAFLVTFARLTEPEAIGISEQVFAEWARSADEVEPSVRSEMPRAIAFIAPGVGLLLLMVLVLLTIFVYVALKVLGLW
jgi:hypothetical protein